MRAYPPSESPSFKPVASSSPGPHYFREHLHFLFSGRKCIIHAHGRMDFCGGFYDRILLAARFTIVSYLVPSFLDASQAIITSIR